MSGICGIINYNNKFGAEQLVRLSKDTDIKIKSTHSTINTYNTFVGITQNNSQGQPANIIYRGVRYVCAFCGELYNSKELSKKIKEELGYDPMENQSFGVIAAWCYILWGGFSPKMLNGKFAYSVYSEGIFKTSTHTPKIFIARDRFGFIPIYYYQAEASEFMFSTSLGAILKTKKEKNYIDKKGIWQIFYLDGKSLPGFTLIKDVYELTAGCCAYLDCRETCKIMIKSYDNYKKTTVFDTCLGNLIEASKATKQISKATERLDISKCVIATEIIAESVKATEYPILPHIYASIINREKNSILYSNIGCEMIKPKNIGIMKGFFPWIRDPYSSIEVIDNHKAQMQKGFNFINSVRESCLNTSGSSYYTDSIYSFYLPMTLKHIEKASSGQNILVKYPFCDNDIASYIMQKGDIADEASSITCSQFEFESHSYEKAETEFVENLLCGLQKLLTNSDSVIKYLCDYNNLSGIISCKSNIKALILLYATHSFAEEFCLDLYAL